MRIRHVLAVFIIGAVLSSAATDNTGNEQLQSDGQLYASERAEDGVVQWDRSETAEDEEERRPRGLIAALMGYPDDFEDINPADVTPSVRSTSSKFKDGRNNYKFYSGSPSSYAKPVTTRFPTKTASTVKQIKATSTDATTVEATTSTAATTTTQSKSDDVTENLRKSSDDGIATSTEASDNKGVSGTKREANPELKPQVPANLRGQPMPAGYILWHPVPAHLIDGQGASSVQNPINADPNTEGKGPLAHPHQPFFIQPGAFVGQFPSNGFPISQFSAPPAMVAPPNEQPQEDRPRQRGEKSKKRTKSRNNRPKNQKGRKPSIQNDQKQTDQQGPVNLPPQPPNGFQNGPFFQPQNQMFRPNEQFHQNGPHSQFQQHGPPQQQFQNGPPQQQFQNGPPRQQFQNGPPQQQFQNGPPRQQFENGAPRQQFQNGPPRQQFESGPPRQQFENGPPRQQFQNGPPRQHFQNGPPRQQFQNGPSPQQFQQNGPQFNRQFPSNGPQQQQQFHNNGPVPHQQQFRNNRPPQQQFHQNGPFPQQHFQQDQQQQFRNTNSQTQEHFGNSNSESQQIQKQRPPQKQQKNNNNQQQNQGNQNGPSNNFKQQKQSPQQNNRPREQFQQQRPQQQFQQQGPHHQVQQQGPQQQFQQQGDQQQFQQQGPQHQGPQQQFPQHQGPQHFREGPPLPPPPPPLPPQQPFGPEPHGPSRLPPPPFFQGDGRFPPQFNPQPNRPVPVPTAHPAKFQIEHEQRMREHFEGPPPPPPPPHFMEPPPFPNNRDFPPPLPPPPPPNFMHGPDNMGPNFNAPPNASPPSPAPLSNVNPSTSPAPINNQEQNNKKPRLLGPTPAAAPPTQNTIPSASFPEPHIAPPPFPNPHHGPPHLPPPPFLHSSSPPPPFGFHANLSPIYTRDYSKITMPTSTPTPAEPANSGKGSQFDREIHNKQPNTNQLGLPLSQIEQFSTVSTLESNFPQHNGPLPSLIPHKPFEHQLRKPEPDAHHFRSRLPPSFDRKVHPNLPDYKPTERSTTTEAPIPAEIASAPSQFAADTYIESHSADIPDVQMQTEHFPSADHDSGHKGYPSSVSPPRSTTTRPTRRSKAKSQKTLSSKHSDSQISPTNDHVFFSSSHPALFQYDVVYSTPLVASTTSTSL